MGRFAYAKRAKRRSSNAAIDAAKALRKAGKEMECVALLLWEELPQWQQDGNQSIETGYRPPADGSYKTCLKSWTYIHNESVNIFSHLIGSLLFVTLPFGIYKELAPRYATADKGDILVFATFFFGVAICFALSTVFHTFINHSEKIANFGVQLDYLGIFLLMWGATIPMIYYGLQCDQLLQMIYWIVLSVFGASSSVFALKPTFRNPCAEPMRACFFTGFVLATLVPVFHGVVLHGWKAQDYRVSLYYLLGVLAFNASGAIAYATKFPERFWRRTFDLFGGSHQIMHMAVLCAAIVHLFGLVRDFDHLHGAPLACKP